MEIAAKSQRGLAEGGIRVGMTEEESKVGKILSQQSQ
jgi:hypothetical protein